MPPVRFALGVASLAFAGLLLKTAMPRLIQGLATMFAGAVAVAIGVLLVGGSVWSALRRLRSRRRGVAPEEAAL